MARAQRSFSAEHAQRRGVHLQLGLAGPSSAGKTRSALRLATGMQRVTGGKIWVIDTENKRSLHYADHFDFEVVPFSEPFDQGSYLDALAFCVKNEAKIVVVDSASHMHEGPGGMLEQHAAEVENLMKQWSSPNKQVSALKCQKPAWNVPKAEFRRFVTRATQFDCHIIWCFRAKLQVNMESGKNEPSYLGYKPVIDPSFIYEMTANYLLTPHCDGVPKLASLDTAERLWVKVPMQFRGIITAHQICEEDGEKMAHWAAGDSIEALPAALPPVAAANTKPRTYAPDTKPWAYTPDMAAKLNAMSTCAEVDAALKILKESGRPLGELEARFDARKKEIDLVNGYVEELGKCRSTGEIDAVVGTFARNYPDGHIPTAISAAVEKARKTVPGAA